MLLSGRSSCQTGVDPAARSGSFEVNWECRTAGSVAPRWEQVALLEPSRSLMTDRDSSSANKGMPSQRTRISWRTSSGSGSSPASFVIKSLLCLEVSFASGRKATFEPLDHGDLNSWRNVTIIIARAMRKRSVIKYRNSSVDGSHQCTSSTTISIGWPCASRSYKVNSVSKVNRFNFSGSRAKALVGSSKGIPRSRAKHANRSAELRPSSVSFAFSFSSRSDGACTLFKDLRFQALDNRVERTVLVIWGTLQLQIEVVALNPFEQLHDELRLAYAGLSR